MSVVHANSLDSSPKQKINRDSDMQVALVARAHLGAIIEHIAPGLPLKSALPRVAARLRINARRVRALWNKEARSILHEEIASMERELALISERELTTGFLRHANRMEAYASRLALDDPDFHCAEIARLRRRAHLVRSVLAEEEA